MNKEWESRLVSLTPGNRRRVKIVGKKLAALLPWTGKRKLEDAGKQPGAPNDLATVLTELRTGPTPEPDRVLRLIRNPAARSLAQGRRSVRAALKVVRASTTSRG